MLFLFVSFLLRNAVINIAIKKFVDGNKARFWQLFVIPGYFNLLAVFKNLFQIIGGAGKLFKLAIKLFFISRPIWLARFPIITTAW